ncbi:cobalamin biosynthesis protein CbiX [Frigidibacter sp. MR17.14]|uniref:cobalamin biosynthesis protein CbiX n=1 Tax=Frigidibacter sp. MR17.14 TaxID=3126509 RepID=UPI003013060A
MPSSVMPARVMIVAHGQPSDPAPAAAALARFAARVAEGLPAGTRVASATLAEADGLERAAAALGDGAGPVRVFPMFMAPGWFTRTALPARLLEAGLGPEAVRILPPFGILDALPDLAVELLTQALGAAGWAAGESHLLLAAHGSFKSAAPAEIAARFAADLAGRLGLAAAAPAFIDQSPRIAEARGWPAQSLCLPFFAASGGHVEDDLPKALTEAGFPGICLPALGLAAAAPALVAAAIRASIADA